MREWEKRERADMHFDNIDRKKLEEVYENVCRHYRTGRIGGTDFHVITSVLMDAMTRETQERETCDDCEWRCKRPQKCSCCRRNRAMKDNYKLGHWALDNLLEVSM